MPLGSWTRVLQPVSATVPGSLPLRNIAQWRCQSCRLCHRRRRRHSAVCNSLILTLTNLSPFIMNAHKGGTKTGEKDTRSVHAAGSLLDGPDGRTDGQFLVSVASSQFPLRVDCLSVCLSAWLSDYLTAFRQCCQTSRRTDVRHHRHWNFHYIFQTRADAWNKSKMPPQFGSAYEAKRVIKMYSYILFLPDITKPEKCIQLLIA